MLRHMKQTGTDVEEVAFILESLHEGLDMEEGGSGEGKSLVDFDLCSSRSASIVEAAQHSRSV